jgi:hypothetical protein
MAMNTIFQVYSNLTIRPSISCMKCSKQRAIFETKDLYVLPINILPDHLVQPLLGRQEVTRSIKGVLEWGRQSIEMPTNWRSTNALREPTPSPSKRKAHKSKLRSKVPQNGTALFPMQSHLEIISCRGMKPI